MSAQESQGFYVVWCPTAGPPTVRHETFGGAKAEAERLAENNPGHTFHVLQSVGDARYSNVQWSYHEHDPIPF